MVRRHIPRNLLLVCLTLAFRAASPEPSLAEGIAIGDIRAYQGIVTITTSPDRTRTYVTMASAEIGKPLAAAFVMQFVPPISAPVKFTGEAEVIFMSYGLEIRTAAGDGWLFKIGDEPLPVVVVNPHGVTVYRDGTHSELRAHLTTVKAIGIARYWWTTGEVDSPLTHNEFARQQEESFLGRMKGR